MARKYARIFVRGRYLFLEAHSFPRAQLEENFELRGTDNVQGQISENIFAPNGGYRVYYSSNLFSQRVPFEIEVNSGRIFTEPRSGEVNILPLFTEIEKNNCFSIYTGSDLNNIFTRKPLKIDLIDLSIRVFTPAILFLFGLRIIHSVGGE